MQIESLFALVLATYYTGSSFQTDILSAPRYERCFTETDSDFVNKPKEGKCEGFSCWESQLSLNSKTNITRIYNNFREKIMKKNELKSMIKMNWHWSLEREALEIISSCPHTGVHCYENTKNIEGLDDFLTCEYSVSGFTLPKLSQEEFLAQLNYFVNNNFMHDYDSLQKFRRISVLYFGCSLTIMNSIEIRGLFVCMYCSKEKSLAIEYETCPNYTKKNSNSSEFQHLCSAIKCDDSYGCEPKKKCYSSPPKVKKSIHLNHSEEIPSNQTRLRIGDRTFKKMEINERNDTYVGTGPEKNPILNYTSLSIDGYAHNTSILNRLKTSSQLTLFQRNNNDARIEISNIQMSRRLSKFENDSPSCCLYLFILNLILMIGLITLVYFTFRHYKTDLSNTG